MPEAVSRNLHPCQRRTLLLLARVRGGGRQARPHPCRTHQSEEIARGNKESALLAFPRGHDLADVVVDLDKSDHRPGGANAAGPFILAEQSAGRQIIASYCDVRRAAICARYTITRSISRSLILSAGKPGMIWPGQARTDLG